tara:strand:- start:1080 stop:2171 length:1092 start_codon:yes stop_codon:yes gene_type:complete
MIKSFVINKYLATEFLKYIITITFLFFCLGLILNLFEQINFFKDFDVGIDLPLFMSALFVPSLLYSMFPFIFLISGIWFFLKIKKTDEVVALKSSGMSNFSIIIIPGILSLILGVFLVIGVNPITSVLVKKYESVKGSYEKDQDYLAAVTTNGIWIKEKNYGNNYIVQSSSIKNQYLLDVTIYIFDEDNNFIKRIEADSADISTLVWDVNNAKIIDKDGKVISEDIPILSFQSVYNLKKIRSLYSNLDTISFWNLDKEIKLLEERGYSTKEIEAKKHESYAFPLFLLSMVLLSGVFTLGMNFKESNWTYIFIAIITSVLVFYFNDFSAALGKTGKLPLELSVWMPILIIFIFSTVGVLHANQK